MYIYIYSARSARLYGDRESSCWVLLYCILLADDFLLLYVCYRSMAVGEMARRRAPRTYESRCAFCFFYPSRRRAPQLYRNIGTLTSVASRRAAVDVDLEWSSFTFIDDVVTGGCLGSRCQAQRRFLHTKKELQQPNFHYLKMNIRSAALHITIHYSILAIGG